MKFLAPFDPDADLTLVSKFYAGVAAVRLFVAAAFTLGFGQDVATVDLKNPIALCPSWLPYGYIAMLQRRTVYRVLYHTVPLTLLLAAALPQWWLPRVVAGVHFAHAHLALVSMTRGHDEYAVMYVLLALCSPAWNPAVIGPGVALAAATYLMFASGAGKLVVGGTGDWCKPDSLRMILQALGTPAPPAGALAQDILRRVLDSPRILTVLSIYSLVVELEAPLAMLLPTGLPMLFACITFHLGHAVLLSVFIGLPFLFNGLPVYLFGYLGAWPLFSPAWMLAAFIVVVVAMAMWLRPAHLLPEDWPCTCYPLFVHSDEQHGRLVRPLTEGRWRLVLCTEACPDPPTECSLAEPWWKSLGEEEETADGVKIGGGRTVHDAWNLLFGWTHTNSPALFFSAEDPPHLRDLLHDWLCERPGLLVERSTGLPLNRVCLIQLEGAKTVLHHPYN